MAATGTGQPKTVCSTVAPEKTETDSFVKEDGDIEDDFAGETDNEANVAALAEVISRAKRSQQRYLVEQMLKGPPGGGVGPFTSLQQQYGETLRQFDSSVIDVSRTAKVTKAGAVFRYRALVVVGNKAGMVGFGMAKAKEVAVATNKAEAQALKNLFYIDLYNGHTIHHDMQTRFGRTKLKMFARPNGSGIKVCVKPYNAYMYILTHVCFCIEKRIDPDPPRASCHALPIFVASSLLARHTSLASP